MKKKTPSPLEQIPVPEVFDQERYIDWVAQYGWYILVSLIGLFAFLFLLYQSEGNTKAENDYINASRSIITLQTSLNQTDREESLKKLSHILKRRPELHAVYDGKIAQILMVEGGDFFLYADKALSRTADPQLAPYQTFAHTSLTIQEGQLEEALLSSKELKTQILTNISTLLETGTPRLSGDILFAYNLLRIAQLHRELGQDLEERAVWQEWNQYLNGEFTTAPENVIDASAFQIVTAAFDAGDVSLTNYIKRLTE